MTYASAVPRSCNASPGSLAPKSQRPNKRLKLAGGGRAWPFTGGKPSRGILIIDDEPAVRKTLRTSLERAGYEVTV